MDMVGDDGQLVMVREVMDMVGEVMDMARGVMKSKFFLAIFFQEIYCINGIVEEMIFCVIFQTIMVSKRIKDR